MTGLRSKWVLGVGLLIGILQGACAQTSLALLIGIDRYAPPEDAILPVAAAGHAADSRFAPGMTWRSLNGPTVDVASMKVLLEQTYQFKDVRVLPEEQATRQGILAALEKLASDAKPNDLVVFYFAGHGSRRLDTLSTRDHFDETIVPIDAWKGAKDIRDKELAVLFNRIVYDKHARLTAIFDSCHSGTMARGIENSTQRTLAYDDRDVAEEKKADPATVIEADLKQVPQKGDAIVLAAAASTESAVEAKYPEDGEYHGAFTRALVRVLGAETQTLSAEDVVASVASMLHADPVPFQQPSVEGRVKESLFGAPVAAHSLHVRVTKVANGAVSLDVGSAAGFDVGTQFTEVGGKTLLEVKRIDGPLEATAAVTTGAATSVKVGQVYELTEMTYPRAARLVLYASTAKTTVDTAAVAKAQGMFSGMTWVDDPTAKTLDFLVVEGATGWVAYGHDGKELAAGPGVKGIGFVLMGPSAAVLDAVRQSPPFQRNAFRFTDRIGEANYLLAARMGAGGAVEYALIDPAVLAAHGPASYVRSGESDPDDTAMNGGVAPEVVCRNDVSLPVRTAWLPDKAGNQAAMVAALNRRIVRLGKLRVWLQSPSLAPGSGGWPYHLAMVRANGTEGVGGGTLAPGEAYQVKISATPDEIAAAKLVPKYVYLFGFDCAANPFLLYPAEGMNGDATLPQPGTGGIYPSNVKLMDESVGTPLGADTLFLMATKEKITDLSVLTSDGVLERGQRGAASRFDELMSDMSDAGMRGPVSVPTNWLVQQMVIPSRP